MTTFKKFLILSALIAPSLSYASVTGPDKIAARVSYQPGRVDDAALRSASPMWRKPTLVTRMHKGAEVGRTAENWRDPGVKPVLWRAPASR